MAYRQKNAERGLALAHALEQWLEADRTYRSAAAERLNVGTSDLDALLLLIDDKTPWTAGKIADALGLTTGAVTGLIDRLEKGGWVQRVRHGVDRRQVWIERAPSRREELDRELAIRRAALATAAETLDDESLANAVTVIERAVAHLRAEVPPKEDPTTDVQEGALTSAPIGNASRGVLRVAGGVANLKLRTGRIKDLYRATFEGRPPLVRVESGTVQLKYRGFGLFGWGGGDTDITLTTALPWALEIRGGASEIKAVLSELTLERIEIVGGASEADFRLPPPQGTVPIRIVGGASEVTFRRPSKIATQIVVTGGASEIRLDRQTLKGGAGVVRLATDGYDSATNRYSIEVTGGASEISVSD